VPSQEKIRDIRHEWGKMAKNSWRIEPISPGEELLEPLCAGHERCRPGSAIHEERRTRARALELFQTQKTLLLSARSTLAAREIKNGARDVEIFDVIEQRLTRALHSPSATRKNSSGGRLMPFGDQPTRPTEPR